MPKLARRITVSLVAGVLVQGLLIVYLFVAASLEQAKAVPGWLTPIGGLVFVYASPGFILFSPAGTLENPHPGFSLSAKLLALLLNIAVYSFVVYALSGLWRLLRSNRT